MDFIDEKNNLFIYQKFLKDQNVIEKYLEDLEQRINPEIENNLISQWIEFINGNFYGKYFHPKRDKKAKSKLDWPQISINEALNDYEKMALHQLKQCSDLLEKGSGGIMMVRCNYGVGIMPSLFGCELFIMEEKINTLPTTKPLKGNIEKIKKLLDIGIPNLYTGLGKKVLEMGEKFKEYFSKYPKISRYVHIYHPDMQGPMDIAELIWGSDLFLEIIDNPDIVKEFLDLITQTYIKFMKKWCEIVPFYTKYGVHWNMIIKGNIMIRDDSAMNLSPDIYKTFIKLYNQKLLNEFSGGVIHFCGRGDHYIKELSSMKKIYGINLSQPEYNDMEIIYKNTVDKGLFIFGLDKNTIEKTLEKGRCLHGKVCYV